MNTMSRDVAYEIARSELDRLAAAANDSFDFLLEETQLTDAGWLFFFNSSDFVRTRNPIDSLAGNGPLLVMNDGQVHQLSSASPWEDAHINNSDVH